jgi:hypothetical protein
MEECFSLTELVNGLTVSFSLMIFYGGMLQPDGTS